MDASWIQFLATFLLLHQTAISSHPVQVIGTLGKSVTFRSPGSDGESALWKFGNQSIVAVAFGDPPQPVFLGEKFKSRFGVSERGRALGISRLRAEDAGIYSVDIEGKEKSAFALQVFRELEEPTVTCEAQNCSGQSCDLSLRCSAPGSGFGDVSYTWESGDRRWDEGSLVLLVNESSRDEPELLTCTARNAVSSRNVTVSTPGVLCTGALRGSGAGIGIGAGIGVALLVLVFLVFLWKSKGWRKFHLSKPEPTDTAEYTTVYAEVGPSQQRVPNGIKAKPADGESSRSVYALVKRPEQADEGTAGNVTVTGLELV
ncbi:PREDICTED: SLAM family member 7 [Pseudopodoces humilis]|uniref:SLAM family member 7 n=1 Tax=Pseudopodoces humilis TaxID=181119 RepID=UPI0006B8303C|nr:PREDICTED: SLAM family member 7 [Pseudopodoces humilis]